MIATQLLYEQVALIVRLCAIGVVISTLEFISLPGTLHDTGLMSWRVSRLDYSWQVRGGFAHSFDRILTYSNTLRLLWVRVFVALCQIVLPSHWTLHPVLVVAAALLTLLLPMRTRLGLDGADQVNMLVLGGGALLMLAPTKLAFNGYLWFLTVQCCWAYTVSGVAKAISPGWRRGQYLARILCIRTYCHPGVAKFALHNPTLILISSWGVILWESCFLVVFLLPYPAQLAFLACGVIFHFTTALLMGLNDFVWGFCCLYPAVIYCANTIGLK